MPRFTKNVTFEDESWDFGNNRGRCVVIGEGDGMLRWAVATNDLFRKTVEPALYGEPERKYLEAGVGGEDYRYEDWEIDESGRAFYWHRPLLKPAVTRPVTTEERAAEEARIERVLNDWCERIYQAGLLLAEGRVEDD